MKVASGPDAVGGAPGSSCPCGRGAGMSPCQPLRPMTGTVVAVRYRQPGPDLTQSRSSAASAAARTSAGAAEASSTTCGLSHGSKASALSSTSDQSGSGT